ncbi:MAG: helix-turn-helix domain-containing protein [Thermoproteota archaeon]
MLRHLAKLLSALFIGLFVSYAVYRALNPLDAFLSNVTGLGLMVSLPFMLILVFYGRLQWAKYFFTLIWVAYLAGMWIYMLVGMSTAFPSYFWIPTMALLMGGMIFLAVVMKRGGISIPWPLHRGEGELEMEGFEGEQEKLKEPEGSGEFNRLKGDEGLPVLIESLNDVECRILLTLLESREQCSKKELQKAVKTTYPRVLRAVNQLSKLGLVEVRELPRRARGASVQHAVGVSRSIVENKADVRELVKRRLVKLEKASPQA